MTGKPAHRFPNPIPSPILIPHWALIDVTVRYKPLFGTCTDGTHQRENFWDPVTAQAAGGKNSRLPGFWPLYIFLPLDSPEIGPGALIGASSTSTPTVSATPTSGSGGSNTSAIIGGVVGAVATLVFAIVFLGIFYMRRRKRANTGVRMAIEEDASIASQSMPDPPLTSTSGRFSVRVFLVAFVLVHVVFFFSCPVLRRIRRIRPPTCCVLRCNQRRGSRTSLHRWFLDHTRDPEAHCLISPRRRSRRRSIASCPPSPLSLQPLTRSSQARACGRSKVLLFSLLGLSQRHGRMRHL